MPKMVIEPQQHLELTLLRPERAGRRRGGVGGPQRHSADLETARLKVASRHDTLKAAINTRPALVAKYLRR